MPVTLTNPMSGKWGSAHWGAENATSGEIPSGGISPISTLSNWQVNVLSELKAFVASNTRGGTGRRPGIYDWNGSFSTYGDKFPLMPGDRFTFVGCVGPEDGKTWDGPQICSVGNAIVDTYTIMWDWANNEPVKAGATMLGGGLLAERIAPQGTVDDTSPEVIPSGDVGIIITPVGGTALPLCFASATLKFSAGSKEYANSCTGSWKARRGGIIDWDLSLVMQEVDTSAIGFSAGDFVSISCQVRPGLNGAYVLYYGIVQDFTNFVVNVETGDIISYTVNIKMSFDDGDGTIGEILIPGVPSTEPYWPLGSGVAGP